MAEAGFEPGTSGLILKEAAVKEHSCCFAVFVQMVPSVQKFTRETERWIFKILHNGNLFHLCLNYLTFVLPLKRKLGFTTTHGGSLMMGLVDIKRSLLLSLYNLDTDL